MRKRSVQEIIQLSGNSFSENIDAEQLKQQQTVIDQDKKNRQKQKPSETQIKINQSEYRAQTDRQKTENQREKLRQQAERSERQKKKDADQARSSARETQAAKVASREKLAKNIAGKKPSLEKITSKDKSVSATGKAAVNVAKSAVSLGRGVASIPAAIAARKAKSKLGDMQMKDGKAPDGGTKTQRIKYAAGEVKKDVQRSSRNTNARIERAKRNVTNAATNVRRKAGSGLEKVAAAGQRFGK